MLKPLLFASLAAIGNAVYVYGQRGATPPTNPFLFIFAAITACLVLLIAASLYYRTSNDLAYINANLAMIGISGVGLFMTFLGFYLLYTNFGASQYALYGVLSILTTSIGVGVLIFKEDFNIYKIASVAFAIAAIVLFTYGNSKSG